MSVNNPQNKNMELSKRCAITQDILQIITLLLAIFQTFTSIIPGKLFLSVSEIILLLDYMASYFSAKNFDEGHFIREVGLFDNSFNEKRIPNYDGEKYYDNDSVTAGHIKLLANIHVNALFTSRITAKMSTPYFIISGIIFTFILLKLFLCGMDDYSSLLLGFIVSSSFFDRAMKIHSLKRSTEEVLKKANELCNFYEKGSIEINVLLPKIIELLLMYESAVYETKIVLDEKIFKELNSSLSLEWNSIKDNYLIYRYDKTE